MTSKPDTTQAEIEPEDITCQGCGEVGSVHWVSRATWKCETCGTDNSLLYVIMAEAERTKLKGGE